MRSDHVPRIPTDALLFLRCKFGESRTKSASFSPLFVSLEEDGEGILRSVFRSASSFARAVNTVGVATIDFAALPTLATVCLLQHTDILHLVAVTFCC